MRTPEEIAREALGNIAGPMRRIFQGSEHAECLDALDVLIEQEAEHLANLIRERDAEVREDAQSGFTYERTVEYSVNGQFSATRLVGPWIPE